MAHPRLIDDVCKNAQYTTVQPATPLRPPRGAQIPMYENELTDLREKLAQLWLAPVFDRARWSSLCAEMWNLLELQIEVSRVDLEIKN